MELKSESNNNSIASIAHLKSMVDQDKPLDKHQPLETPPSSAVFSEIIKSVVTGRPAAKMNALADSTESYSKQQNKVTSQADLPHEPPPPPPAPPQPWPKRACRSPLSRKFAHPCTCGPSSNYYKALQLYPNTNSSTNSLPPAAYTAPLHLYDPHTKKCLPTSRNRDMLLKECHPHGVNSLTVKPHHNAPCFYDDLTCDARRFRCVCKPNLHLYYESNMTFGCVPIGPTNSPDGRTNCKPGYVYNVISRECQRIFDVNELPPNYATGVSATQFSFVTIVLIWILLLILIVTAKLRKLRTANIYRNSPSSERRLHHGSSSRNQSQSTSAWLHPFIAAVNGHHHLNQHRTTVDRHSQGMAIDDSGNYTDTDFFLANNNRRINEMLSDNNFAGSQQSLNNPPPKFEEIYPSCIEDHGITRPPSNEDLPSYDEAMKLQNTMPPDPKE